MTAAKKAVQRRSRHTVPDDSPVGARVTAATRRNTRPLADPPPVAPCADLNTLQALSPAQAREHVASYLRDVMSPDEASAFEVYRYRWDLHLVAIDHLHLVRGVELDRAKLRRFRRALARGACFPAVVGLGNDGEDVTGDVLLCDGYHRAVAMRDAGIPFVWAWLATEVRMRAQACMPVLSA